MEQTYFPLLLLSLLRKQYCAEFLILQGKKFNLEEFIFQYRILVHLLMSRVVCDSFRMSAAVVFCKSTFSSRCDDWICGLHRTSVQNLLGSNNKIKTYQTHFEHELEASETIWDFSLLKKDLEAGIIIIIIITIIGPVTLIFTVQNTVILYQRKVLKTGSPFNTYIFVYLNLPS